MIEIQPVTFDEANAHDSAIQRAIHLLHCAAHTIDAMPDAPMIAADLAVLLWKIEDEVSAARVLWRATETPFGVAPEPE